MSRAASRDGLSVTGISQDNIRVNPNVMKEHTLVVPDPDAWSTHLAAARQNLGSPSSERKLSNIDEADMKFRNHRDSFTMAHSRLICSGVFDPSFSHTGTRSQLRRSECTPRTMRPRYANTHIDQNLSQNLETHRVTVLLEILRCRS